MTQERTVHEPDAELLSAEDAIHDAERLSVLFHERGHTEQAIALQVPLSILLEAIDQLDSTSLRQIAQRVEERLAVVND
jgi:hypothetical protein